MYTNFRVTGISRAPYNRYAKELADRGLGTKENPLPCVLVRDTENKYDANAILVMVQTPIGRQPLGYVPSLRYCTTCDPKHEGRGYRAYGPEEQTHCPDCGNLLELGLAEQLRKVLDINPTQVCTLVFIGGTADKQNIGAVVNCSLEVY